jgi:hypothetical protein
MTRTLITLELLGNDNTLGFVKQVEGLKDLDIDEEYGLVLISPKKHLYVIRVNGPVDAEKLMSVQPKVKGVSADVRIAPFNQ